MKNDDTSLNLSVFGLLEHLKKIHANKIRTMISLKFLMTLKKC